MRFEDALYNWLQIHIVAQARPDDHAARETESFFSEILKEDHHLRQFSIGREDESGYEVHYEKDGEQQTRRFERELADQLLSDINANPKYNE